MRYRYIALISITLGGKEFLPGRPLPEGIDYEDLYKAGMVSREGTEETTPIKLSLPVTIKKTKKKTNGKRKNNSNR